MISKNILVLTGSPRKGGNSDRLADAFIAGARQSGHTAVKCSAADKDIKGCIDCKTCFSKGVPCSISDDFNALAPLLEEADVLVLATPMYWFSFPAQLKAAIDKLYAYLYADRPLKIKECVLLVCGGEEDAAQFEGVVKSYQLIAKFLRWRDRGTIMVLGLHDEDDVVRTDGLNRAEALGKTL